MNEHTSLYEYWRSLLMEEQQNEERNNRLMRKLDEIEQRTSLLNERSERLKQLRENLSDLIRQRYLSEDEVIPDGNFFSKSHEYSPPEYIPDPILLGLSTPPWVPCGPAKPVFPSKEDDSPNWTAPLVPSAPLLGSRPEQDPTKSGEQQEGSTPSPKDEKGPAKQKLTWMNRFPTSGADFSLFEPSVSWLPDGSDFFRTTSALETGHGVPRPDVCRAETKSVVPPPPSVMSHYSYYLPNNMALAAQQKDTVATSTTIPDFGNMQITHTTDVLLSDDFVRCDGGKDPSRRPEEAKPKQDDGSKKQTRRAHDGAKPHQQRWKEPSKALPKGEPQDAPVRPPRNPNRRRVAAGEPQKRELRKAEQQTTKVRKDSKETVPKQQTTEDDSTERSATTFKESSYRQDLYEQKQQLEKKESEFLKSEEGPKAACGTVPWKENGEAHKHRQEDASQRTSGPAQTQENLEQKDSSASGAETSAPQESVKHTHNGDSNKSAQWQARTEDKEKPEKGGADSDSKRRTSTSSSSSSSTSSSSTSSSSTSSSSTSSSSTSSSNKDSIGKEIAETKAALSEENSEDSFFDKETGVTGTPAYQMLLGQKPTMPKDKTPGSDHPSESSNEIENELVVAVMSSQPSKQRDRGDEDKTSEPPSNASTPPEYDVASVNVHNLISARVRQKIPSLLSRKVLGLDLYSAPALPKSKKTDDEDSFFD